MGDAIDGDLFDWSETVEAEQKTSWFSFGYDHRHEIDGRVFGHDTIAKITAPDPRSVMLAVFGREWCWEYFEPPTHPKMKDLPVLEVRIVVSEETHDRQD